MNKSELIKAVAEKTDLTQAQAKEAVNTALDVIKEATLSEGKVSLAEFGTFKKHISAPRAGRNPSTGELLEIPSKTSIKFKAS
ncbi:MAG TPA: HU family DNA-binding protein [Flavobacterium lutivivi]|nr:HU family DNA-binding protein [Flavobacterium lutivivi]